MNKVTSNVLKICAILFMIVDHIGFYFVDNISTEFYIVCRVIGRASMPLFCFLIVQGFLHTSNKKKYFIRLIILAVLTEIGIRTVGYINKLYFPNYLTSITSYYNVVFSLAISVLILSIVEFKSKNIEKNKNGLLTKIVSVVIKTFAICLILSIYKFVKIDYSIYIPIMIFGMYIVEKYVTRKNDILGRILICFIIFSICVIHEKFIGIFCFIAFPVILLYNGKLGKKSKILQYTFYITFLLQHIILYSLAMIANK